MTINIYTIGVMTGTSADGADLALNVYSVSKGREMRGGQGLAHLSVAYPSRLRNRILKAQKGLMPLREYLVLKRDYSIWIVDQLTKARRKWKNLAQWSLLVCGVHGQTLWHSPPVRYPSKKGSSYLSGMTLQMVDGPLIAALFGSTTVTGFRNGDMALGGQGAPLAPGYHLFLAQNGVLQGGLPIVIQNLGGIGNLTYLDHRLDSSIAFDTGPANVLIDLAVAKITKGKNKFDDQGAIARRGKIHWDIVDKLSGDPYFRKRPPKSTGRELFNKEYLGRFGLSGVDLVATVTAFTAKTLCDAYTKYLPQGGKKIRAVYFAGGGSKNKYLLELTDAILSRVLCKKVPIVTLDQALAKSSSGICSQNLEAAAFGFLALRVFLGLPINDPSITGAKKHTASAAVHAGDNYPDLIKAIKPLF